MATATCCLIGRLSSEPEKLPDWFPAALGVHCSPTEIHRDLLCLVLCLMQTKTEWFANPINPNFIEHRDLSRFSESFEDIKLQIIRYSKSSELYVDKCYSEIVPQVADAFYFLQIDEPQHIFTSEKLCLFKRPFYTQSCWVLIFMPVNLKCSSIFPAFCWPHPNFFLFFLLLVLSSKWATVFLKMLLFPLLWIKYGFMMF